MKDLLNKLNVMNLDNKKIFLIALVCAMVLYIDFTYVLKLQLKGMNTLTQKIIKLKNDADNLAKDLSMLHDLERNAGKDKAKMGAVKPKEIISEDKILLLLQEVSDLANKNKITIKQINTSKDAKAQGEVIAGEKLLPVVITMDLTCGYHSLGGFINDLENAGQFIEIEDMKIIRSPHNYLLENVNLTLKTYAKK